MNTSMLIHDKLANARAQRVAALELSLKHETCTACRQELLKALWKLSQNPNDTETCLVTIDECGCGSHGKSAGVSKEALRTRVDDQSVVPGQAL